MPLPIHVFHESAAAMLGQLVHERDPARVVHVLSDLEALRAALPEIEVLFAPMPPRSGWRGASRLRLLQIAGVGVDHLLPSPDLPAAVEVAGLRGLFADAVAEHVTLMALVLTRRLLPMLEASRRRTFRARPVPRLAGRRVVVLGAGAIGRAVADRLSGLGVEVDGVSRRGVARPEFARVFSSCELPRALHGADGLVVAVPLTDETRGIVDAEALDALAPGAFVIDVSRGGVVNEGALLAALDRERLVVARDVFEHEPLPEDSPFFDRPNCVVTPHVAGYVEGYLEGAVAVLIDNVERLERGEPLQRRIDRVSNY